MHGKPNHVMTKRKILIMDDEVIVCFVLARRLRDLEYEVETAGDGFAAIEIHESEHINFSTLTIYYYDRFIKGVYQIIFALIFLDF